MDAFVARQAILNRDQQVVGYELLFRSTQHSDSFDAGEGTDATSQLIANSLFAIGLTNMLGGRKAFVNFTRDLLVSGYACALPAKITVVEVLESVHPDEEVIAACRRLKKYGYTLALDDVVSASGHGVLARLADIVKVDFQATQPRQQEELMQFFSRYDIKMLAEKLETREEFERARKLGYRYFQGYFIARPTIVAGKRPPAWLWAQSVSTSYPSSGSR